MTRPADAGPPGFAYGLAGFPIAFAALPLYVQLPAHYAGTLGMPLATVGWILLAVRAFDAVADPVIGRWIDARVIGDAPTLRLALLLAAVGLAAGFTALFFPLPSWRSAARLLPWCAASLVLASVAHSVCTVIHQAWGARIAVGDAAQARLVAWREGCGLAGVVTASVLPSLAGFGPTAGVLAGALAIGVFGLLRCPLPTPREAAPSLPSGAPTPAAPSLFAPWRQPGFARLLAVFMLNGTASAVPATLVLFFVRDRLQAPAQEAAFLAAYFVAAALSLPLWVRAMARFGLARGWRAGMLLSIASFAGAVALGPGDRAAFFAICVASGAALGADLVAPPALLAAVIRHGASGGAGSPPAADPAAASFGWWNLASKLNLALAAGLGLPLLARWGYAPGQRDAQALQALQLGYAALPCALKLGAVLLLSRIWIHLEETST